MSHHTICREDAACFVLDGMEHRVLDADSAFYNLTNYRAGERFEGIFEKSDRAMVRQFMDESTETERVGSLTARIQTREGFAATVCVFFQRRSSLSGKVRIYGAIAKVSLLGPSESAQPKSCAYTMKDLQLGIAHDEFSLHIQPFYNLNTGKIAGGEILTRWIKDGEEILPAEFFTQLDNTNLGCELDYHVFVSAMPTLSVIAAKMGSGFPISFNISGQHFNTTGFAERVEALAEAFGVDKSTIMFEIKADLLETRNGDILQQLSDLREAGFRIVVDEIKGDSRSLMVIESGLVDMVKMERTFVARCVDTGFGQELLKLLLETTRKYGIHMICTGVETEQQRDFLKKCGCIYAQGFLLSKPVSLREFEASAFQGS